MRSNKIRENIDPKPFVRAGERGTYCLASWEGPCPMSPSSLWITTHDCEVKIDHKDRHQCRCGVSRMRQPDDPEWKDKP